MGSYSIDRERVTVGQLAGTMMACPPPEMAIDSALRDALAGPLLFRVAEDRLTLTSESDAEPRLVFEAAPPPRLDGIAWEVTAFNNGRHAVVGVLTGTTLTVTFNEDGSVVGHSGCNSFRASYTRDGDRLTIGAAAATRKLCAEKGVMVQEREFLAALESTTTWALDREMLDLHRADGERVLTAREAAK
jgi:heat shock protein HslJ